MAYTDQINGTDVDRSYSKVVNLGTCKIPYVRSFEIITDDSKYALKINTNKLIGIYPTINAALGALIGCFHAVGCNDEYAIEVIEQMIADGKGIIPVSLLQSINFVFISASDAIIVSSGEEVVNSSKTSQLTFEDSLRLWNGAFTGLLSPYAFTTFKQCEAYWAQFRAEASVNGGPFVSLGDPIAGSVPSTQYINTSTPLAPGGTWVAGTAVILNIYYAS